MHFFKRRRISRYVGLFGYDSKPLTRNLEAFQLYLISKKYVWSLNLRKYCSGLADRKSGVCPDSSTV